MTAAERGPRGQWQHMAWWRNGQIDLDETLKRMPADDMMAAMDIAVSRDGELHYAADTWYIWDGKCHRPDVSHRADRIIIGYALDYRQALDACKEQVSQRTAMQMSGADAQAVRRAIETAWKPWEPRVKYAASLRKTAGAASLLRYLANAVAVSEEDLAERHPEWLNCRNGTVDLATGTLRPHDPADLLTYCLDVAYNPQAACPMFFDLLYRMTGQDKQVAAYLHKCLGYALLGENPERLIIFIAGPTSSGKSKLLHVVSQVLGPLAEGSKTDLICYVRHGRNARTENSIRGRRLITISETESMMHIEVSQVKRLTGEEEIAVDQHYAKEQLKTPVTWLIIVAANTMPSILDFDEGAQERVIVIPGGPTIPETERDRQLTRKILASEKEGILATLVEGCKLYHREGLGPPAAVQMETARYRQRQDSVANFIADTCLMAPGYVRNGVPAHITMTDAWDRYVDWARSTAKLRRNEFHGHMSRQPGVVRVDDGARVRRYEGLVWRQEDHIQLPYGTSR